MCPMRCGRIGRRLTRVKRPPMDGHGLRDLASAGTLVVFHLAHGFVLFALHARIVCGLTVQIAASDILLFFLTHIAPPISGNLNLNCVRPLRQTDNTILRSGLYMIYVNHPHTKNHNRYIIKNRRLYSDHFRSINRKKFHCDEPIFYFFRLHGKPFPCIFMIIGLIFLP